MPPAKGVPGAPLSEALNHKGRSIQRPTGKLPAHIPEGAAQAGGTHLALLSREFASRSASCVAMTARVVVVVVVNLLETTTVPGQP